MKRSEPNDYAIGCLRFYLKNHEEMGVRNERSVQLTHAIAILKGEVSDEFLLAWASELYCSISEDPTFGNREKAINNLKAWGTLLIQAHTKEKP